MKYLKTYENINGVTFKEWLEDNTININIDYIDCRSLNLIDIDGIEEFKNLKHIICNNNKLTKLPDLSNLIYLEELYCNNNNLIELPDLSSLTNLISLHCSYNKLSELPDLSNLKKLAYLYCNNNKLPFRCERGNNLEEYMKWHKKEYPWIYDAKKYNL
jgi:Leucine-rich repeat (LRR) protein